MSMLDADTRERLVEEFRACLEDGAALPDAEDAMVDLHTLLSELAVLKNEVRLESRQVKAALDETRSLTVVLQESNARQSRELERSREQAVDAGRRVERQLLLEVLDLRDRIEAGLSAVRAHRPGWLARLCARRPLRFLRSLGEGQALTLRRLDHLLARYRVRPIECLHRPLDPRCMNVVGIRTSNSGEEGIVLEQQRVGFEQDGEVLRCAEVIVNKRNAST